MLVVRNRVEVGRKMIVVEKDKKDRRLLINKVKKARKKRRRNKNNKRINKNHRNRNYNKFYNPLPLLLEMQMIVAI